MNPSTIASETEPERTGPASHHPVSPLLRVDVHGLGYVGTVTAACLADSGHHVRGLDIDQTKVEQLRRRQPPVAEPGLQTIVERTVFLGRLSAQCNSSAAPLDSNESLKHRPDATDVHLVCVGTPSLDTGEPDITAVKTVVHRLAADIAAQVDRADQPQQHFTVIVVRSTVLPGTVRAMASEVSESLGLQAGTHYGLAMCPEFLREGSAVSDFFEPPFTVAGVSDQRTANTIRTLFGFLDRPFHIVGFEEAEMLKYACNAFHALKVAFANEIGRVAQASGADGPAVMDIFRQDDRLNVSDAYLRPGFAFGGSCLPKDLRALASHTRRMHLQLPIVNSVLRSNDTHLRWAFDLIQGRRPRRVAFLGITFKPDTDDLRESPYVALAEALIGKGVDVTIWDPVLDPARLRGANQRFADNQLPHLASLLQPTADHALQGSNVCVVASADPAVRTALDANPDVAVIDVATIFSPSMAARTVASDGRQPVRLS